MEKNDLVAFAREQAAVGTDLYSKLSVDVTTPKEAIHKAWRKAALKYHPDKTGDAYNPTLYELLERARDVLVDDAARDAYDAAMRTRLLLLRRRADMSDKKRRMIAELEAAEKAGTALAAAWTGYGPKWTRVGVADGGDETDSPAAAEEKRKATETGRQKMAERKRLFDEAEAREGERKRQSQCRTATTALAARKGDDDVLMAGMDAQDAPEDLDAKIAELERRLKENREQKAERKKQRRTDKEKARRKRGGSNSDAAAAGESATSSQPQSPPIAPRPKADSSISASEPPTTGSNFALVMARLRAAQAQKDKKRMAEAGQA